MYDSDPPNCFCFTEDKMADSGQTPSPSAPGHASVRTDTAVKETSPGRSKEAKGGHKMREIASLILAGKRR